jgi:type I restriction enzyme M protein
MTDCPYINDLKSHMSKKDDRLKSRLASRLEKVNSLRSDQTLIETVLLSLEEDYGYPNEWLSNNTVVVTSLNDDSEEEVVLDFHGIVYLNSSKKPYFCLAISDTKCPVTEEMLRRVMDTLPSIALGGFTNGVPNGTRFIRKNFYSSELEYILDIDTYYPQLLSSAFENDKKTKGTANVLETLSDNIENIFFEIHSYLRDIDGLHPDDALDELCKLIYAKIYDEEHTPKGKLFKFQKWIYSSNEELSFSIRQLYQDARDYDLRVFRLKIPQYDRSRGVFNSPLRLSSTALQRSVEALERYALSFSSADIKGRAFQKVLDKAVRYGMGQFFTPEPIVNLMVSVCNPLITDLILDPFCGSAHFLSRSLEHVRIDCNNTNDKLFHEFAFGKLHGIEKSDRMVRIAMRLHGDGHSNIRCTDSLSDFDNFSDISPSSFDLILTNPPFGSLLGADSINRLGHFELSHGKKNVPLEILGIERCVQFLRPGGRMAIVLPDSTLSNKNTGYVRDWMNNVLKLRAIVSLPIETFSPFGANVKTSIIFARKWKVGEIKNGNHHVFICQIDSIGYDAAGRIKNDSDIPFAVIELSKFFSIEGW